MFDTLLSNNNLKAELSHAASADKPLHAYMFCGAEGSGKKTAALQFASEIIGEGKEKALRGTHPDVIFLRPEDGKRTISVEQVRNMRADAFITPTEGKRKVYIVDGAHLLNDAGQNALLTVLEQPPSFSVFILLTESREKMLPTVISRCTVYEMEYVDPKDGARLLQKEITDIPYERLELYVRAAQGNLGLAKKIATDRDYAKYVELSENITVAIAKGDKYTVAKTLTKMKKDVLPAFLQVLTIYLRDVAVKNAGAGTDTLVFSDSILKNGAVFDKIEVDKLFNCITECMKAQAELEASISLSLVSADLVTQLCGGRSVD